MAEGWCRTACVCRHSLVLSSYQQRPPCGRRHVLASGLCHRFGHGMVVSSGLDQAVGAFPVQARGFLANLAQRTTKASRARAHITAHRARGDQRIPRTFPHRSKNITRPLPALANRVTVYQMLCKAPGFSRRRYKERRPRRLTPQRMPLRGERTFDNIVWAGRCGK